MSEPIAAERAGQYAAFISYRHQDLDRRWAKWLLDALEGFRTPRALVKRGFPARLGRSYRDEDENPASAELSDQIDQCLAVSGALIVVATRATPASRWIDREVRTFQDLGRGTRILVLLVEGEPAESYPRPLLVDPDREPLAADVRPRRGESQRGLKRLAVLRIAAAILGCSFDDLRRRDWQRRRRRLIVNVALGAVVSALLIGGLSAAQRSREWARQEQAVEQVRRDVMRTSEQDRAALMFRRLPRSEIAISGLSPAARRIIEPVANLAALEEWELSYEDGAATVIAPIGDAEVAVGTQNGAVGRTSGPNLTWLRPPPCEPQMFGLQACAITAIAARGSTIAAGTAAGEVLILGAPLAEGDPVQVSGLRIDEIVLGGDGAVFAADAAGAIFRVEGRKASTLAQRGGSVARFLVGPGDTLMVLRVNGRVEVLTASGLRQVGRSDRVIRSGYLDGDAIVTLETPISRHGDDDQQKLVVRYAGGRREVRPARSLQESLPETFEDGVWFVPGEDRVLVGRGRSFYDVDLEAERARAIELAPEPFTAGELTSVFQYRGAIVLAADGHSAYSIYAGRLDRIRFDRLEEVRRLLDAGNARARLCAAGYEPLFRGDRVPGSAC